MKQNGQCVDVKVCEDCGSELPVTAFQRTCNHHWFPICKNCHAKKSLGPQQEGHRRRQARRAGVDEIPVGMKWCGRCKSLKPLNQFHPYKNPNGKRLGFRYLCIFCERADTRARQPGKKEYFKNWKLLKKYGITLEDYKQLAESQAGRCAICGRLPGPGKSLVVDHDHATDEVRGLLCNDCNIGIGKLGDDADALRRALNYLTHPPAPSVLEGSLNAT